MRMEKKFEGRWRILRIVWIIAPSIVLAITYLTAGLWIRLLRGTDEPHVLDGLRLLFPVFVVALPTVGVAFLAPVLFPLMRRLTFRKVAFVVLSGLILQVLLFLAVSLLRLVPDLASAETGSMLTGFRLLVLGGAMMFIPTLAIQAAFAGLFFGLSRIRRMPIVGALIVSLVVLVALVVGVLFGLQWRSQKQFIKATEERHSAYRAELIRRHVFRETAKRDTMFGRLAKRPYRVFRRTDGTYLTVDADGRETVFPFQIPADRDPKREMFLDVFGDRMFYRTTDGGVAVYSPGSEPRVLTGEIVGFVSKPACATFGCDYFPSLSGVHGPYLALDRTASAGTANVGVFDIRTGERVIMSTYAGYDTRRAYQFWIDGQGYRLILNAADEPETFPVVKSGGVARRTWQPPAKIMRFYLEAFDGKPYEVPDEDFFPSGFGMENATTTSEFPWVDVAFRGGPSEYLAKRTPFFELPSSVQGPDAPKFGDDIAYFTVRSLYKLDSAHVGLEVNEGLVLIDLPARTASFVTDEVGIEKALKDAVLIAADDDSTDAPGYCPENDDTLKRQQRDGMELERCVF